MSGSHCTLVAQPGLGTPGPSCCAWLPLKEKEHICTWQVYSEGLQVAGADQVSPFSGLGGRSVLKTDLPREAEDRALTMFAAAVAPGKAPGLRSWSSV